LISTRGVTSSGSLSIKKKTHKSTYQQDATQTLKTINDENKPLQLDSGSTPLSPSRIQFSSFSWLVVEEMAVAFVVAVVVVVVEVVESSLLRRPSNLTNWLVVVVGNSFKNKIAD